MNNYINKINRIKEQIDKLEKDFKRGVPLYHGFTLDVYYGGNTEIDLERICIGSISDDKNVSEIFYNLILNSLKNSLAFWKKSAEQELLELTTCLSLLK